MSEFEQKMRRLKDALHLTHDHEVAAALGMTKASLSDRKRRDSFPVERVIGLAGMPHGINVDYVLTGLDADQREMARRRGAVAEFAYGPDVRNAPTTDEAAKQAASGERLRKEVVLGTLLSWCTDDDLNLMLQLAARLGSTKNHRAGLKTAVADCLNPASRVPAGAGKRAGTTAASAVPPGGISVLIGEAGDGVASRPVKPMRKSAKKTVMR